MAATHFAGPGNALALAEGIGALPPRGLIAGCQVAAVDDLLRELTPAVARAVEQVARELPRLVGAWLSETVQRPSPASR